MHEDVFLAKETAESMNFTDIINSLEVRTPYGRQAKAKMQPYLPGQEEELRQELARVGAFSVFRKENLPFARSLDGHLDRIKDLRRSVENALDGVVLDELELFEIKLFLLAVGDVAGIVAKVRHPLPGALQLDRVENVLDALDPRGARDSSFYIEDSYTPALTKLREEIRQLERELYVRAKAMREQVKEETGASVRSSGEIMIAKHDTEKVALIERHPLVAMVGSTFTHLSFKLVPDQLMAQLENRLETLHLEEEQEEFVVRQKLSGIVKEHAALIMRDMDAIGLLDLLLAKARIIERFKAVLPEILEGEPCLVIRAGRHPVVEGNLRRKGRSFTPVSIDLRRGAAVITGANMGGKTVALKTVAVLAAMAQFALPVPAEACKIALFGFIFFSGGDYQSVDEGLSTFGAEISRLKQAYPRKEERGLYCLDELARGTNPHEGCAIAVALVRHLHHSTSMTLVTTHFEALAQDTTFSHWQVRGLKDADFEAIRHRILSQGKNSLEALHEFMDYRLEKVEGGHQLPKDALNVARLMGLEPEILKTAEGLLKALSDEAGIAKIGMIPAR